MEHKNKLMWAQLLITLAVLLFRTVSTTPAQTVPEIAEKALAATVYLEMQDNNGLPLGFGSGFFLKSNLIATNYHVIAGAASGTAKLVGKSTTYKIEGFTATNKYNDLVLLKVSVSDIKPLPLGNSDAIKIGETVYVAGNPKGLEGTFSDGIISSRHGGHAKGRLQMTAPISPGSSGGPVLNRMGKVVGVSYAILEGDQNLNFAIPSLYVKTLLALSGSVKSLSQGNHSISAETYFARGNTKAALGQYVAATSDYDKAIQLKPDDADAYYNRGLAKRSLGQRPAAINDFDKAIQLKSDLAEAYINRGLVKVDLGLYSAAISDYDKAIQLEPNYAEAYNNRGTTKHELGQHDTAIQNYDKAIQLKPDYADAYNNRGLAKADLGQYFVAISDYNKAIQLKPDIAGAYFNRGNAKMSLGQHFAAISDYNKAIQLKPDYADAYNNRGATKRKLSQHFAAISDYNKATQLKPDYADAYFNRGNAKLDLRQHFAAISDYDKAIQLKPDHTRAYVNRGAVKTLLNRTWEAKQDLQTALKLAEQAGDEDLKAKIKDALRLLE